MVLADSLKQFLLHLESYLVYEKEHEVGMFAAGCFLCQYIEANLKIM